jgi:WD40 repeat protein
MVWLWKTSTRQPIRRLPPEPSGLLNRLTSSPSMIFRIAFSPDGRLLAAGDGASQVTLWDTDTGRSVRALRGWPPEAHEVVRAIGSLAFSSDGTRLAAGLGIPNMSVGDYGRQIVKVWDPRTGDEMGSWEAHANTIAGLAFAPDGRRLATASHDGTVKLWEAGTWRELRSWAAESISVRRIGAGDSAADPSPRSRGFESVAFSPDGRSVAAGLADGTIVAWDLANGRERYARRGHGSRVYDLAYSRDGRTLASAGWDRLIKLWDARTGRELRTFRGHGNWVMGVAFTPDSRNLASLDFDGVLRLWGEPTGRGTVDHDFPAPPVADAVAGPAEKAAVSPIPEASRSLIGRWEGKIQVDKTTSLRIVIRVTAGPDGQLRAVLDSPDQGAKDIPVSAMTLEDGVWSWTIPAIRARFEGKATGGKDVYEGTFLQNGIKMPLVLERTDRARR